MEKQIIVNNLLLSFTETNKSEKRALLFLHGWRSNKEVWCGIIDKVEGAGMKVYALDLPGFGKSQAPTGEWHVIDYANIVEGFIRKFELSDVILVGHSFGGRVGIKLSIEKPELIKKLVLVDSAAFPAPEGKKKLLGVAAKLVKPLFKPSFMRGLKKNIYRKIGAEDYVATPELQKTFVNIVNEDLTGDLKKIVIPTLIVYGDRDADTPVSYGEKMNTLIPNSQLRILNNAGHYSFLDKPEEFSGLLKTFLQK